jgi:hypothetical protein
MFTTTSLMVFEALQLQSAVDTTALAGGGLVVGRPFT